MGSEFPRRPRQYRCRKRACFARPESWAASPADRQPSSEPKPILIDRQPTPRLISPEAQKKSSRLTFRHVHYCMSEEPSNLFQVFSTSCIACRQKRSRGSRGHIWMGYLGNFILRFTRHVVCTYTRIGSFMCFFFGEPWLVRLKQANIVKVCLFIFKPKTKTI